MAKFSEIIVNIFFLVLLLQFAPTVFNSIKKQYSKFLFPRTKVGLVTISGPIWSSSFYTRWLKKFFESDEIKAILINIESPGGAAGAAEAVAHEIAFLKKEFPKPVVTISENVCASGAYYIASCCDYIFASPSTLIGSIGTYIPFQFKLKDFLEQYKIHYEEIKAGEYKLSTDPFVNLTPEQREQLQSVAQSSYDYFVQYVAKHRPKVSLDKKDEWADGKLFTGLQAKKLELVDALGSRSDALIKLQELALIEGKIEWVRPTARYSFWNVFSPIDPGEEEETIVTKIANLFWSNIENKIANHRIQ